jgi:hypothetical protein
MNTPRRGIPGCTKLPNPWALIAYLKDYKISTLLYRAQSDGWDNNKFHSLCIGKGATVTIVILKNGHVFGGFTSIPWNKYGQYQHDPLSFLFRLSNGKFNCKPIKIRQTGKSAISIRHISGNHGPWFGSGDLVVHLTEPNASYSVLGYGYRNPLQNPQIPYSEPNQTFLAGKYNCWDVQDVFVYLCTKP